MQQAQQRRTRDRDEHERRDEAGDDQEGTASDARGVFDLLRGDSGGGAAPAQAHAGRDAEEAGIDGVGRVLRGRGRGSIRGILATRGTEEQNG